MPWRVARRFYSLTKTFISFFSSVSTDCDFFVFSTLVPKGSRSDELELVSLSESSRILYSVGETDGLKELRETDSLSSIEMFVNTRDEFARDDSVP